MKTTIFAAVAAAAAFSLAPMSASATTASSIDVDYGSYGVGGFDPSDFTPGNAIDSDMSTFFRMSLGGKALFGWGGTEITNMSVIFETTNGCADANLDGFCDSFAEEVHAYALIDSSYVPAADADFTGFPAGGPASAPQVIIDENDAAFSLLTSIGNFSAQGGFTVDLTTVADPIFGILLVDTSSAIAGAGSTPSWDGFDITEVKAQVIPVPAGVLLIGSAFVLAGAARRFGRKADA